MQLNGVEEHDDHLAIDMAGSIARFHYFWLRDNCPDCRSGNGQKLHESNRLDPQIVPRSTHCADDVLSVTWSDGQHSDYPASFLAKWRYDSPARDNPSAGHWGAEIGQRVRRHDYADVCQQPAAKRDWLFDVANDGFSLLRNVPTEPGTIFEVVGSFGFVRDTNYGRLFEVRAEENASNLAYTPQPLSVHTDNPYRDPCPTLQLLHCLHQAEQGGYTALSDGFFAAEKLRETSPTSFDLLSTCEVEFHYESDTAILDNSDRIITLNGDGSVRRVRINNRSIAPLRLPFERMQRFYQALFEFRALLEDESSQFQFLMQPGDLLLLDNERVLHGRVGESVGERHLQGCYADRDGLLSTLRVLQRELDQ